MDTSNPQYDPFLYRSPLIKFFDPAASSPDVLDASIVTSQFFDFACALDNLLPDGPEKTTALRKLLEAKDCALRAIFPND